MIGTPGLRIHFAVTSPFEMRFPRRLSAPREYAVTTPREEPVMMQISPSVIDDTVGDFASQTAQIDSSRLLISGMPSSGSDWPTEFARKRPRISSVERKYDKPPGKPSPQTIPNAWLTSITLGTPTKPCPIP